MPAGVRLPLRAYHAALFFKNGVPVGYFEGLSLFERMESGFNLYYTFRDGETAWLYAKTLNIFHHLLGVTSFAIDPYQIGYENEEGIESGAFWFYRKLGFRPTAPAVTKLVLKEETKLASDAGTEHHEHPTETPQADGFELDQTNTGYGIGGIPFENSDRSQVAWLKLSATLTHARNGTKISRLGNSCRGLRHRADCFDCFAVAYRW